MKNSISPSKLSKFIFLSLLLFPAIAYAQKTRKQLELSPEDIVFDTQSKYDNEQSAERNPDKKIEGPKKNQEQTIRY